MNGQHFRALLWLRWRLAANQFRRGGTANAVILIILTALAVLLAVGLFAGAFLAGYFLPANASPTTLLLVWDGMVLGFLFFWCIGLISDLQRAEALSLNKFLHLPVSLSGAFLINYLSSLFHPVMILLGPALLGLALGLACARGPAWLLLVPALAAFLLAVTALTYQFQGWLATLMANPRRRRTVIVVATMTLVLLCQAPNLINVLRPWKTDPSKQSSELARRQADLHRELKDGTITLEEFQQRSARLEGDLKKEAAEETRQSLRQWGETAEFLNLVLPPGWVALGAAGLTDGSPLPALLGTLGLGLIGAGSLWRAYRTTVRFYTGQAKPGRRKPAAAPAPVGPARPARLLEGRIPGLSEQAAAITLGSFRSLTRAPEAKMMLLTPLLMVVLFGGMLLGQQRAALPEPLRPLLAFGAMAMVLLGMVQLMGNQFGFDRAGFRVFVLCGAPRRDVLLGKNLAAAPLALGMGTLLAVLIQVVAPLRVDHFLAFFPQAVAMYLVYCLLVNGMSILAPLPVAAGAFRPTNFKGLPLLLNLAFMPVFPAVMAPLLLPLAAEWATGLPLFLPLALAECAAVAGLYWLAIGGQGRWLQSREQKILQVVAAKAE